MINTQFQTISQFPKVKKLNFSAITFATEEIGETPRSPRFVTATPNAEKNRPMTSRTYLLSISVFVIFLASIIKSENTPLFVITITNYSLAHCRKNVNRIIVQIFLVNCLRICLQAVPGFAGK